MAHQSPLSPAWDSLHTPPLAVCAALGVHTQKTPSIQYADHTVAQSFVVNTRVDFWTPIDMVEVSEMDGDVLILPIYTRSVLPQRQSPTCHYLCGYADKQVFGLYKPPQYL